VWRIGDEESLQRGGAGNPNANAGGPAIKNRSSNPDFNASGSNTPASPERGISKAFSTKSSNINVLAPPEEPKKRNQIIDLRRVPNVDILADKALIGYCKIIAEINRSSKILGYRNEPRLTEKGKHEFKVRMGFGLHAGWAIEGAVGSLQKVDATYLSPHVNMAARLETSSRQYGVPLLASQDFYDLMSNDGQQVCRKLDVVTVKGSEVPIGIYTYDCVQDQHFESDEKRKHRSTLDPPADGSPPKKKRGSFHEGDAPKSGKNHGPNASISLALQTVQAAELDGKPQIVFVGPDAVTADVFERDYDMLTLRKHINSQFLDVFKEGINLYLAGEWHLAKAKLETSNEMMKTLAPTLVGGEGKQGDGPSQTLLNYMSNHNFEAPKTWKGFRPLTSK
jgi:hypothetical protein